MPIERLNQAAVLMMALVPGDLAGVIRLQQELAAAAGDPELPAPAAPPLQRCIALLDDVIMAVRTVADVEATLIAEMDAATQMLEGHAPAALEPAPEPMAVPAGAVQPAVAMTESDVAAGQAPGDFMLDSGLDLLPDFIAESLDYIDAAEAALLALEAEPGDVESINVVFRAFHTIKGTSAFLGLAPISELAHHAESLLSRVRDGELPFSGGCADMSLRSADLLKELIEAVRGARSGQPVELPAGYAEFMALLAAPDAELQRRTARLGDILVADGKVDRERLEAVASRGEGPLGLALVREQAVSAADVAQALRKQRGAEAPDTAVAADTFVRVRTERLDQLVDLVGELVVAQSMVAADGGLRGSAALELTRKVTQAGKIVRELQDLSMSLRMVPLKPTFQKIARLVRDVSRKAGKQVDLVTEGEDTEIDRNMVDILGDPLVHMVRNAIDHGIERPDDRLAAGKLVTGIVRLRAFHSGGSVVVELQDDGRGLNRERILEKAHARGIIDPERTVTDAELYNLIFHAGFSTAEQVTDLSGRGVGMDVVRRNVESIRGRVDIQSVPGQGATFTMRLPLTLAITDGMLVRVGDERYVVPTVSIQTSFRPTAGNLSTVNGRGEIVLLHGEVIPVLRLHRVFEVGDAVTDPTQALLVVIGEGSRRVALLVDELLGQQQFVAKPLGQGMGKVPGVSGGAVLGDGRVGLILDAGEVIGLGQLGPRVVEPDAA